MPTGSKPRDEVIGQVAVKLTGLPEEDLSLVIRFVSYLEGQRAPGDNREPSAAELRSEARRLAELLREVPDDQMRARLAELAEEIRQEAITQGTAVDGDWSGD